MSGSLFSPSWYRVAALRPRLRAHAELHRHHYRDERWYVLQDHASGRFHRLGPAAYHTLSLMDGVRTVAQIWDQAMEALEDDAPSQEELIQLLAQLHSADVLQSDITPDGEELFRRYQRQQRSQWLRHVWSPLALRFPLLDPDRFLRRWLELVRPLFGWAGVALWLAVVVSGTVLAGLHWADLTENIADRVLAPQNLLLLWLVYPAVKALHELGHAFATRVWGGEVHEMGIMLLVLMPVPYVDASAASAFREKHRRIVVGAAGIGVELFLAALALFVWVSVEPGLVSALAYNVMLIGGVSTLLFNGNPLLRFDGYYVFADAIDIPNLASRSTKYLAYLCQRYAFGVRDAVSPAALRAERVWFVTYGIASFVYRMFIMFFIVTFVAGKMFFIGVLLAAWAVLTQLLVPFSKMIKFLFTSPRLRRQRPRALSVTAGVVGAAAAVLLIVPVPLTTIAEGVVWLPERAYVRAGADGFVSQLVARPGTEVRAGEPLVRSADPLLPTRIQILEAHLRALAARHAAERLEDRVRAQITREEMAAVDADLAREREREAGLLLTARGAGRFVVPGEHDLPGRYLRQGALVGYLLDEGPITVRVAVSQDEIGLVRSRTRAVRVRLAEAVRRALPAELLREVPAGRNELPSVALGSSGGGRFPVDPRDPNAVKALERVFQLDLAVPTLEAWPTAGGRVYVRFDHGAEPLAWQWYRSARQLFLRRFGV